MLYKPQTAIVGLVLLLSLCSCGQKVFRQGSAAMEPTIKKGERIVVDLAAYSSAAPARWDVVVFQLPGSGTLTCSRVAGLPGETIDIRPQGILINGTNLALPAHLSNLVHLPSIPREFPVLVSGETVAFPFSIPAGSYFVLGDNTTNAFDSRYWGALPLKNINGRVLRE